jgi:effector-binding domain-containing protein
MKFILKLSLFLLLVSIVLAITALFLPEDFKVVKKMDIHTSPIIVFNQVNNFHNWESWSPWQDKDSLMTVNISDNYYGKGAKMNWQSEEIGNCDVSITHSVFPESIALHFDTPSKSKTVALIYFEPTPQGTLINFTFNINKLDFWEKYFLLYTQNEIENTIEKGVHNLKTISEELKYSRISEIVIDSVSAKHAVIKIDSTSANNLDVQMKSGFSYLDRFLERREITALDVPFSINFNSANDTLKKIAVGRYIPERTWVWRTLQYYYIPAGKAVITTHYGKPNTKKAHQAIQNYISKNNLKTSGVPWEEYRFNPETDKDTSLWEVKVYYPIE